MPRTGRPPDSIEVKRRRGTLRGDRLPVGAQLAAVPGLEVATLDLPAREAVERVVGAGFWLAESDAPTVALLRDAVEDYQRMRDAGIHSAKEIREARAEVERLAGACGFNPRDRARLGLAEVKAASKLEQIRKARGV